MRTRFITVLTLFWLAAVAASAAWDWRQTNRTVFSMALKEAQSHFEKDVIYRRWAALQGGVYVPTSARTPPNPHLAFLPERDVTTTDGRRLTLINPAYMTRQVHELAHTEYGVQGHITSLNPLRPENAADPWERQALVGFQAGTREAVTVADMAGKPYLRYMRPMTTEASCLKCHARQGYKVGDVRGGISVTVPYAPYLAVAARQHGAVVLGHAAIGLVGLAGIWFGGRRLARAEHGLRQAVSDAEMLAARNDQLLSNLGEGVYGVDPAGRCVFINPAALAMLHLREADVIGQDQHLLFHARREDGSPYPHEDCPVHLTLQDGQARKEEDAFLRDGQLFPVQLLVTPLRQNGDITGAVVVFEDISDRRQAEQRIRQLAYYDTLTALPNRRLLLDRLVLALTQAKRHRRSLAVMFLDLDRFKLVNDTLGHDAGDALLQQVGKRLLGCVRAGDTVARTGGDEFVILLPEIAQAQDAALVAEKVIASFAQPFPVQDRLLEVTTSIGIAEYPVDGTDDSQELLKKADVAMYQAKEAGRNGYRFYQAG